MSNLFSKNFKNPFQNEKPVRSKSKNLIYAVGDVHGRYDLLLHILRLIRKDMKEAQTSANDYDKILVVFLGDYIDRGDESKDVIETLCQTDLIEAETVFLKGNHEEALLDFIGDAEAGATWVRFGGRETLLSYGISLPKDIEKDFDWEKVRQSFVAKIPEQHLSFLQSLPSFKIDGEYMFVHAGIDPGKPVEAQTDQDFLWIRDSFLKSMKKLPYIVVHGHTPEGQPVWDGRRIGIDTGAYISNKLTAARLLNGTVGFLST
jgi:serine/threonine protein phosphatase 1